MESPLLPRITGGDSTAVEECLDRYGGLVWSLARRLSPSQADAEDAVQEIFIDLWKNAGRYRAEAGTEVTFVAMIARRRLIDRMRKQSRQPLAESLETADVDFPSPPATASFEVAEEASRARACLEHVRSEERQVLELSIYHGLPQAEIAERTGFPLGTVKTHVRRGLLQLRNCMQLRNRNREAGGVT